MAITAVAAFCQLEGHPSDSCDERRLLASALPYCDRRRHAM
jgi:hypothetical protein